MPLAPEHQVVREMLAARVLSRAGAPNTLSVNLGTRYTELEAEVETESAPATRRWFRAGGGQLRLEPSLVLALERGREPVILLEGEPGSGKTVSLHRVERIFAERIRSRPDCSLPLPLCVKLKHVAVDGGTPSDRIKACILRTLDADATAAARLFDQGLRSGGWLLLLDGFDEIPGVLGAIEVTTEIQAYALAIHDLCTEARTVCDACRVVVATRHYHGPKGMSWTRFRLQPLSAARKAEFIANFALPTAKLTKLVDHLATAPIEIQQWADNPLTLAMLCEVIQGGEEPPGNIYGLFEQYLELRFERDSGRIRELFGSPERLRRIAENIGFVMSAEPGLGLAPTTSAIRAALVHHDLPTTDLVRALDTIERLELTIRYEDGNEPKTGFRHRRLQEYFATCVLLREPDRLQADALLFDARWREASVVLLQRGALPVLEPFLGRIEEALCEFHAKLGITPLAVDLELPARAAMAWTLVHLQASKAAPRRIGWPSTSHHILNLLQAGFTFRQDLPPVLGRLCVSLLMHIYRSSTRIDKKYALEVIGVLPAGYLEGFALVALDSHSDLLQNLAFQQLPRLGELSEDSQRHLSRLLYRMARSGKLAQDPLATRARIRRTRSEELEQLFELASRSLRIDRILRIALFLVFCLLAVLAGTIVAAMSGPPVIVAAFAIPPLLALSIRDTSSDYLFASRYLLDTFTWMVATTFGAALTSALGLGLFGIFIGPVLWAYANAWGACALMAVYYQVPVARRYWLLLPVYLPIALFRRAKMRWTIGGASVTFVTFTGIWSSSNAEPPARLLVAIGLIAIAVMMIVSVSLVRRGITHALDRLAESVSRRKHRIFDGPSLRTAMAGLRTSSARIRLLRAVLQERRVSSVLDDPTRTDLEAFLVALETHAAEVASMKAINTWRTRWYSVKEFVTLRVYFEDSYSASCEAEHQRWCLTHCATSITIDDMSTMIDLLTSLLQRAEDLVGGPRTGFAAIAEVPTR